MAQPLMLDDKLVFQVNVDGATPNAGWFIWKFLTVATFPFFPTVCTVNVPLLPPGSVQEGEDTHATSMPKKNMNH